MIGTIASALWRPMAAILALVGWTWLQRRQGAQAAHTAQAEANVKAVQNGADGAAQAKADMRKGKTPQEVKDANDAKWR